MTDYYAEQRKERAADKCDHGCGSRLRCSVCREYDQGLDLHDAKARVKELEAELADVRALDEWAHGVGGEWTTAADKEGDAWRWRVFLYPVDDGMKRVFPPGNGRVCGPEQARHMAAETLRLEKRGA